MSPATRARGQRTDAAIFVEARRALDQRAGVPAGVRVHVEQGILTLTGSVQWPAELAAAEDAVRSIPGVQRTVNDITVGQIASKEGYEPPDVA